MDVNNNNNVIQEPQQHHPVHQPPIQQQPNVLRSETPPETNISGMTLIAPERQYSVGMGKDQQPNSRLWIETPHDSKQVHLYCLDKSDDDKDVFICGHCKQFNRITAVEILHPDGGKTELWEQQTHFPSCIRQKVDVEKYLYGFEKPIAVTPRQPRTPQSNNRRRRSSADTPPSRSRSRSPLTPSAPSTPTTSTTTTPAEKIDSSNQYRGRKPNMQAMSIIPKTHWRMKNVINGVADADTKLFIFTHPEKNLGREYSYGVTFDGGVLFYCDNCLFLTRERQKRKAFYKVVKGKVIIREANHYATCRPYELRHTFDNSENDNVEDVEVDAGSEDGSSMETERSYDSQEPETTIEYDSTTAPSPDIPEPPAPPPAAVVAPTKTIQKYRSRTAKNKSTPAAASTKIPPSTAPTFRPVFETTTPASNATLSRQQHAPPTRRYSTTGATVQPAAAPIYAAPTPVPVQIQQQPTPSSTVTPAAAPTPSVIPSTPIITLQRTLQSSNIPSEFKPYLLPADRTLMYNTPSSGQMREYATKFGFPFSYKCYQFWSSTLSSISEINGSSKVITTRSMSSPQADDFSCLSLFLTGAEEYGKQIQEGIKEYFCNTYFTDTGFTLPREVIQHSLITNSLTDIHLHILSKMINCSIAVFNGDQVEIFGLTNDETTPFMLLKKSDTNKYVPVLGITTTN